MELRVFTDVNEAVEDLVTVSRTEQRVAHRWLLEQPPPASLGTLPYRDASEARNAEIEYVFVKDAKQYWDMRLTLVPSVPTICIVFPSLNEWRAAQVPVYLVSPPKAGTHLVLRMLSVMGYSHGGVCPLSPESTHFYSLFQPSFHAEPVTHLNRLNDSGELMGGRLLPLSSGLLVALFREPAAMIASALDYEFDAGHSVLGHAEYLSAQDRVESFFDDDGMHGHRLTYLNRFAEWLTFPTVFPIAYEELSSTPQQLRATRDLQLALCAAGRDEDLLSAAWGGSETYRGGNALHRVEISQRTRDRIRKSASKYLRATGRLEHGTTDWSARRAAARRPADLRPVEQDLELERSERYVLFYRRARIVARLMLINGDPPPTLQMRYPFLQASFATLDQARTWALLNEVQAEARSEEIAAAAAEFHAAGR